MEISGSASGFPATDVTAAFERLTRFLVRLGARGDLSLTAVAALGTLERSGPCRLTELAAREGVTQPAMTQLVSRLQESGLVARAGDPEDRRVVQVHITDAGRAALAERRGTRAGMLAELMDRLGEDDRASLLAAVPAIDRLTRLVPEDRWTVRRPL
ncbi:MarR family transcriptional regulator [Sphaerisporangium siamense]|uniref:DNA-binding MarR family transcriptional regulator n=1 Tax=Sphaerisporangium siamense TaxID=795645 RepID=A0A7W7G8B0_9ACTN|nr:MarR family transcriptional regulator [Sphaerisporangium siamense]MBB4701573.1 DNA-binding MarR family transcriptional regulator [Sphaerisporangium siamense]GII85699.1 MarR family transcriptional regulator [Sphaerisporangium siamense]